MRKYLVNVCVLFFLIAPLRFFAQDRELDSLLLIIKTSKVDTLKVNVLNNLFLWFEFEDDVKAQKYLNEAFELSKKCGYKKGEAMSYAYKGFFAEDKGNYAEALKYYLASLKIREALKDKAGAGDSYLYIGNVYYAQENYNEAFKKFTNALTIFLELDKKRNIAIAYNNIGGVYFHQKNYEEALNKYALALKIRKILDDQRGVAESYASIGNVYSDQGNYDKALETYFEAIKILEGTGGKSVLAGLYTNVGITFTLKKQFVQGKMFLQKAEQLALEIDYKQCLSNAYDGLSELDSATGNYKGAYENHKLYILYRDSLDNEETRKKIIQNQMTYDFEKKEAVAQAEHKKELENQELIANEKSRKQKIVIWFVICGLVLVVLFAGFIFRSLRITRKQKSIIEEQKRIVETQKQEVELQKIMVEEHQKAIIDSITYARRIQQSLLPTEKYIERSMERLNKR